MADKARWISERNLHERLAFKGPQDELKDLADTFDGLLARLDSAFEAQRRFVANASHELRTPLTLQRTMIEVALSDPQADTDSLRSVCRRVIAAGENQESLIEALLTLASSQRGLAQREPMDIAVLVADVLRDRNLTHAEQGIRLESNLRPACTDGSPRLIQRLITNLIDNAFQHNVPGGWVHVLTSVANGRPILRVSNSGPLVPHNCTDALFQPFHRLESRTRRHEGHGLGLSIVAAVVAAHNADIRVRPLCEGGLEVEIRFA